MKKVGEKKNAEEFVWIDKMSVGLLIIFLAIAIAFFVSLNKVTGAGFGFLEIIYAVIFSIFLTAFLVWTKSVSVNNPHLAWLIGLSGIALAGYAFSMKFKGKYSTIFLITTFLIVLAYLVMNFIKYKKRID